MDDQLRTTRGNRVPSEAGHSAVVELFVSAVVRRAAEDVALAFRFMELAGIIPAEHVRKRRPCPVPLDPIFKAAAIMRLLCWQNLPGNPAASAGLPPPQA